jgi:hypothetical protein
MPTVGAFVARAELSLLGNASIQLLTRQLMLRLNDHPGDLDCMQVAITIGSALLCCRAIPTLGLI